MYSEMLESYQNLIDSPETPRDQKAIAAKEISNINKRKNGLMIAENLIKNKGFEDVVILVNDNIVSVVVKSYILNQEQISKIQNIVERELDVEIKNINISNRY
jgi:stage III sporulation protein AH